MLKDIIIVLYLSLWLIHQEIEGLSTSSSPQFFF